MSQPQKNKDSNWQKTSVSNLIQYKPSGTYFARIRVRGKLIRRSLKTDVLSVARLRLADFQKEQILLSERLNGEGNRDMSFDQALNLFLKNVDSDPDRSDRTKSYYRERVVSLYKSWPSLKKRKLREVSRRDLLDWQSDYREKNCATAFNATIGIIRRTFDTGIEEGVIYQNPSLSLKRARVPNKKVQLPTSEQFELLLETIETSGSGFARPCADLVRFLAYGGFRIGEAGAIRWHHVDCEKNLISVPGTKTETSDRTIPMIPQMRELLARLSAHRPPPMDEVMKVKECMKSLRRACGIIGIPALTHHDFRKLFTTRAIESGVDIPTVSRWLGHKDGGALLMRVYGKLRDEHSTQMAEKVSF